MSDAGKPNTKSGLAFAYIKKSIINGTWKPGEKIPSENKLCEALGVSRVSVRSAINQLSSLGILKSQRGGGTYVCEANLLEPFNSMIPLMLLSKPDRISMFEFRKIIEVESAGLAASRATFDMVEAMKRETDAMIAASEVEDIAYHDLEFHYMIAKATANIAIIRVFEILRDVYFHLLEENVDVMGAEGAKYHKQLICAFETRNPELARQHMLDHLDETMKALSLSVDDLER